jgi:hypothetical protein
MGRGLSQQQVRILKSAVRRQGYIYPWRAQQVVASVAGVLSKAEHFSYQEHRQRQATGRLVMDATAERQNAIKASASRALTRLVERGLLEFQPARLQNFERPGAIVPHFTPARYKITDLGRQAVPSKKSSKRPRPLTDNAFEHIEDALSYSTNGKSSKLTYYQVYAVS